MLDFKQSDYELAQLQDLAYSDYDVKLDDLGVAVSKSNLPADALLTEVEHVLKPLSILFSFHVLDSKAQATSDLPKYKIKAQMDELRCAISNYRVVQVLYIVNSIKSKWADNPSTAPSAVSFADMPLIVPNRAAVMSESCDLADSLYQIQLALPERDSDDNLFYDATSELTLSETRSFDTQTTYSSSLSETAVQMFISVKVGTIIIDLLDETAAEHVCINMLTYVYISVLLLYYVYINLLKVLNLRVSYVVADYTVKKLSSRMIGHCQTIDATYRPDDEFKTLAILSSGLVDEAAIQLDFHEADLGHTIESDINFAGASVKANGNRRLS